MCRWDTHSTYIRSFCFLVVVQGSLCLTFRPAVFTKIVLPRHQTPNSIIPHSNNESINQSIIFCIDNIYWVPSMVCVLLSITVVALSSLPYAPRHLHPGSVVDTTVYIYIHTTILKTVVRCVSSSRGKLGLEMCEQRARLSTSHVLSPVDRFHAPCVFVVVVCPPHQQELNNAHLVVMCGIEKTGPTGLATKQNAR